MALQIEMFEGPDYKEVKSRANAWLLAEKPDVRFVTQSESGTGSGSWSMILTFVYEDPDFIGGPVEVAEGELPLPIYSGASLGKIAERPTPIEVDPVRLPS